uniref:Putative secreted protein n=1 Tax=Anopheles triannulatus TaxID=58253 RepID=A0A2M4B6E2_9DIPT
MPCIAVICMCLMTQKVIAQRDDRHVLSENMVYTHSSGCFCTCTMFMRNLRECPKMKRKSLSNSSGVRSHSDVAIRC